MYKQMDRKQDVGHFFCLLDIEAFMDLETFKERIDATIDRIKACRLRPGFEEILVPGEPEHRKALENRRVGIRLEPATLKDLRALCERHHVRCPLDGG